jgi:hypothetical protein
MKGCAAVSNAQEHADNATAEVIPDLESGDCVPKVVLAAVQFSREALLQDVEALASRICHVFGETHNVHFEFGRTQR